MVVVVPPPPPLVEKGHNRRRHQDTGPMIRPPVEKEDEDDDDSIVLGLTDSPGWAKIMDCCPDDDTSSKASFIRSYAQASKSAAWSGCKKIPLLLREADVVAVVVIVWSFVLLLPCFLSLLPIRGNYGDVCGRRFFPNQRERCFFLHMFFSWVGHGWNGHHCFFAWQKCEPAKNWTVFFTMAVNDFAG